MRGLWGVLLFFLVRMHFCSGFVGLAIWLFFVGCCEKSSHISAWMADRVGSQGVSFAC
jgi:hypothetical protein